MKKQVVFIHGGSAYDTYEEYIESLKNKDFDPDYEKKKKWRYVSEEKLGSDFEVFLTWRFDLQVRWI